LPDFAPIQQTPEKKTFTETFEQSVNRYKKKSTDVQYCSELDNFEIKIVICVAILSSFLYAKNWIFPPSNFFNFSELF
jgi:hypothetical protein